METIKVAIGEFDDLSIEIDCVTSLSYLLWESMAEGLNEANDTHITAAFMLCREMETLQNKLQEINEKMHNGLKEVRA